MKVLKYIALGCIAIISISSCSNYLDVNTDPDSPNNESALVENRLPWIQRMYMYNLGISNMRTACIAGVYYSNNSSNVAGSVTWAMPTNSYTTSAYQTWFVECAANLTDLYNKAAAENAYYYMAAADVFHAMGFMQMIDLYGEIPYTQALGSSVSPAYDNGKTVFNGCIAKLDEAISLFSKAQPSTATAFSKGDMWNGGDVNKWIKLCYGLKARYLLKLSKKSDLYDPTTILSCLEKGPQSISDNTVMTCYNSGSDVTDYLYSDPVMTNGNWNYAAYGSNQRISAFYYNLLTNMRGAGITDPRMSKIVPATMSKVILKNGTVSSYAWNRSAPVDIYGDATRLKAAGAATIAVTTYADKAVTKSYTIADETARNKFIAACEGVHAYTVKGNVVSVTYAPGSMYINSTNYIYAGDTIYVNLRSGSELTGNTGRPETDLYWYPSTTAQSAGVIASTGSYQVRPVSDFEILTYHEMCFIKAEVLLRKGDASGALTAYKAGIQAHLDMMQKKLTDWKSGGYDNPDMMPMNSNDITSYMASDAVCQTSSTLKMSDIMLQKYLAMGCSIENWNDMRRFNFSAGNIGSFGVVYPSYDRSPLFAGQSQITGSTKTDPTYWVRRWRLPYLLELQYNMTNAQAANTHALDLNIWSIPVWWDCATDSEYFNYIGVTGN